VARIRTVPEDFRVEELPLYPPSGEGGHTFVRLEKRLRTTEEVANDLARAAKVQPRDIGYAGRKDRVAVAEQTFSVPGLDPVQALELTLTGVRVLDAVPHGHKLRTGQLRGNRFEIAIREIDEHERAAVRSRLEELCCTGMPNRFGAQRFGRDGRNVGIGARILRGKARITDRRKARFAISALQSAVFNEVLASRPIPLSRLEVGDVAMLHESGGQFVVEDVAVEQLRADAFEISPTGPIFGTRVIEPAAAVAEREARALAQHGVLLSEIKPPRGIRLRGARRSLRVRPIEAATREFDDGLWLDFALPPGSYATVLMREVLGEDPSAGPRDTGPSGEVS
jgi:tRNA pseudouridine13 synthase